MRLASPLAPRAAPTEPSHVSARRCPTSSRSPTLTLHLRKNLSERYFFSSFLAGESVFKAFALKKLVWFGFFFSF